MADALFGEPRLAAIYDAVEGERRVDLDHYLAIAEEFGALCSEPYLLMR